MIRIGTSGWSYKHWIGGFYPPELKPARHLEFYARHFDAVEINATHYRLPTPEAFLSWRDQAPEGFVFAVKASRYITHYTKLTQASRTYALFFDRVALLGPKLGPILFQTPPQWRVDVQRLDTFLSGLPAGFSTAFEFRNPTWFDDTVFAVLERHGAAFCQWHLAGQSSPEVVTAPLVYVRLHGPAGAYAGSYSDADLSGWAERLRAWAAEGRRVHLYFDNDDKACAVGDAQRLKRIMGI